MKPSLVADEMFPEGAGPYMDIEEVRMFSLSTTIRKLTQTGKVLGWVLTVQVDMEDYHIIAHN